MCGDWIVDSRYKDTYPPCSSPWRESSDLYLSNLSFITTFSDHSNPLLPLIAIPWKNLSVAPALEKIEKLMQDCQVGSSYITMTLWQSQYCLNFSNDSISRIFPWYPTNRPSSFILNQTKPVELKSIFVGLNPKMPNKTSNSIGLVKVKSII